MQTVYTKLKVNNEIELCEIVDLDTKQKVEKILLQHRISYYIKWPKQKWFCRNKILCILCVNDNFRDEAETAIKTLDDEIENKLHFIMRKSSNEFF